jgi:O-glycosyl hydrolase
MNKKTSARIFRFQVSAFRSKVSPLISLVILALSLSRAVAAPVDYTAAINPHAVLVDNFEGWGTSLCWWANVLGGSIDREQYADLAFKKLQLNIVRYNIGGGENPAISNSMELRARMPGFEPRLGVWDWNADANQRWFLRAAVARGVNRVEAFANSPPYWMTVSGSTAGTANAADNNLRAECEPQFADYLATVVSNLTVLDGVKFDLITPMNEPASDWWHFGGRQEGTHMSADQQARMIKLLRPALDRRGLSAGLIGSEDNAEQLAFESVSAYDPATQKLLARVASHTYHANNPDGLRQLAAAIGRPLWISEYGDGEPSGLTLARRIRDDIVQTHACAWIYWQFAEPGGNWGLVRYHMRDTNGPLSLNKKFYVMSQFSRFIRPGFQILEAGDTNSLVAYDSAGHQLVLVSVNDGERPLTVAYDLVAFRVPAAPVQGWRTSDSEDLQAVNSAAITGGKLIATLPPRSVTTLVITDILPRPN